MENVHKVPFLYLLDEFRDYCDNNHIRSKVKRIHKQCLINGKFSLAAKIRNKYHRYWETCDDRVMSTAMALMYLKQQDKL